MKRKLKILILTFYPNQSIPLRTQLAEVFGKYLSKKHKIVAFVRIKSEKKSHFFWENIEFYNVPSFKKYVKKVFQVVNSDKFDLIFSRDALSLLLICILIKKKSNIPLFFQFINPIKYFAEFNRKWYHPKSIGGSIKERLLMKFMKKADLILPPSEWMGKYLISNRIDKKKIYVFENGANIGLFQPSKYPQSNKNPKFIYMGTLSKIRKLDILIKAMKIVCEKYKDAQLFMVGKGNDLNNLRNLTRKYGLEKNIIFTGLVPYENVHKYISKSHIALCPIPPYYQYQVSSPLKLFEYMSCSRPVIANKELPPHVKTIKNSKGGLLVDFNAESFAKSMIQLFQTSEKAEKMGLNGRKWLEENQSYERIAKDFENKVLKLIFN